MDERICEAHSCRRHMAQARPRTDARAGQAHPPCCPCGPARSSAACRASTWSLSGARTAGPPGGRSAGGMLALVGTACVPAAARAKSAGPQLSPPAHLLLRLGHRRAALLLQLLHRVQLALQRLGAPLLRKQLCLDLRARGGEGPGGLGRWRPRADGGVCKLLGPCSLRRLASTCCCVSGPPAGPPASRCGAADAGTGADRACLPLGRRRLRRQVPKQHRRLRSSSWADQHGPVRSACRPATGEREGRGRRCSGAPAAAAAAAAERRRRGEKGVRRAVERSREYHVLTRYSHA